MQRFKICVCVCVFVDVFFVFTGKVCIDEVTFDYCACRALSLSACY